MEKLIRMIKRNIEESKEYLNNQDYFEEYEVESVEDLIDVVNNQDNEPQWEVGYIKGMENVLFSSTENLLFISIGGL